MSEHEKNGDFTEDQMVKAPNHYQSEKGIEVIDVIEAFTENLVGIEIKRTVFRIWKKQSGTLTI